MEISFIRIKCIHYIVFCQIKRKKERKKERIQNITEKMFVKTETSHRTHIYHIF